MTKKRDKPLHIDMSFDEALKRFAQTDPREIAAKRKKPKTPRKASSPKAAPRQSNGHSRADS
jgi:hypothetical protein